MLTYSIKSLQLAMLCVLYLTQNKLLKLMHTLGNGPTNKNIHLHFLFR